MSVMSNNIQLEKKSIFTTKLLLSIYFLCCAKSFSSLLFKYTKRKLHQLYLFTQCLWWHVKLFKTNLKNWSGLEWKDENDILTNVKNVYQSWLVHSERLHKDLCSFNTGSLPRNQQGSVLKIATDGGWKMAPLVVPARTCLTMFGQVQKVGGNKYFSSLQALEPIQICL